MWNAISGCLNDGAACIVQNTALITKAALPPEIFPLRVVLTHFLNYLLTLPLLFGFSLLRGLVPTTHALQLLYLIPIAMLFMLSVVLGLSVLGAFYRDIQFLVNTLSFALFFTIPVTYPMSILPEKLQAVLMLSPLTQLIQMSADAVIFGKTINTGMLTATLGMTISFLVISLLIVRKFHTRINIDCHTESQSHIHPTAVNTHRQIHKLTYSSKLNNFIIPLAQESHRKP